MTPKEFEYLKRAINELEKPPGIWQRAKILRTMSQITAKAADEYEIEFQNRVNHNINQRSI